MQTGFNPESSEKLPSPQRISVVDKPAVRADETQQAFLEHVNRAVGAINFDEIRRTYWDQNEAVFIDQFLSGDAVERYLLPEVEQLRVHIHRNYIPRHKKGGSVSYYTLLEKESLLLTLYRSPAFIDFLSRMTGAPLQRCPENDPHSCALYYYTEPGDHIGFHYDTSYYKSARYTVLMGLIQKTENCQLVCHLYKDDPKREVKEVQIATQPGSMVIFNGDKLWHAITPLGKGEERVVLTMEYVISTEMGKFKRFVSNMKDAVAYFGFSELLKTRPRR
jgi:hypothetical protein